MSSLHHGPSTSSLDLEQHKRERLDLGPKTTGWEAPLGETSDKDPVDNFLAQCECLKLLVTVTGVRFVLSVHGV